MASLPLFHSFHQDSKRAIPESQIAAETSNQRFRDHSFDRPKWGILPDYPSNDPPKWNVLLKDAQPSPPSTLQALSNTGKKALTAVEQISQDLVIKSKKVTSSSPSTTEEPKLSEWDYEKFIKSKSKADMETLIVGLMIHIDTPSGRQYKPSKISTIFKHQNRKAWKHLKSSRVSEQYKLLESNQRDPQNPFRHWQFKWAAEQRLRALEVRTPLLEEEVKGLYDKLRQPGQTRKIMAFMIREVDLKEKSVKQSKLNMAGRKGLCEDAD